MNKKKTNFLVAILNLTEIVSILVLHFGTSYLLSGMMSSENVMTSIYNGFTNENVLTSIYNSFISETLLNNIDIFLIIIHSVVGVINIICAIQNKKNKKLFFWQMVFGIYELYAAFLLCDLSKSLCNILDDYDALEFSKKIISIIPIICWRYSTCGVRFVRHIWSILECNSCNHAINLCSFSRQKNRRD